MAPDPEDRFKFCPSCAESVRSAAARCRFCGHVFGESAPLVPPDREPPVNSDEIVDLLEALVERSLVIFDEASGRFRLLDTVRDYAKDKAASTSADIQARHARYCASNAERQKVNLQGAKAQAALRVLTAEEPNARAVFDWASQSPEGVEIGLRLCAALAPYWHIRGQFGEGRARCAETISHAEREPQRAAEAMLAAVLSAAGNLAFAQGDNEQAVGYHCRTLPLREASQDRNGLAMTLHNLAIAQAALGSLESSLALEERALALNRELGDRVREASNLNSLAMIAAQHGNEVRALGLYEEAAAIADELGDAWSSSMAEFNLAELLHRRGSLNDARRRLASCLEKCEQLEAWPIAAVACELLARLKLDEGRPREAAQTLGIAESIRASSNLPMSPGEAESLRLVRQIVEKDRKLRAEWKRGRSVAPLEGLALARKLAGVSDQQDELATVPK